MNTYEHETEPVDEAATPEKTKIVIRLLDKIETTTSSNSVGN
ncbi:hypothetical protein [Microbispora siamensis]|uniref:Uncharacterized protein n=1 Tax=Microbispora siamensis TaxID=564413 RepID=A0ABQ4GM67_9ACTN|nr:hypothetical protein [Microbispora siamensis]GIH62455.1 hypothetical protein Msi02_32720 [Microbispora siamensis]